MESHTHQDLINKCQNNDRKAQFKIYKLYSRAMYNIACRILGNESNAEDVLQEAFISAFTNLSSYRGDASFGSWLKRIVINKALNQINKKQDYLVYEYPKLVSEESVDERENSYVSLTANKIKKAVKQLPNGLRTVFSLYLFDGYDHGEISNILNISESTSKTQYKRAKERIRKIIEKEN